MSKRLGIGVVGLGHWGPNHIRTFDLCDGAEVVVAADKSESRRKQMQSLFRHTAIVADAAEVLAHPDVDAVVIATPAQTHYALARAAMAAGKHVLLEKPMCTSLGEAHELVDFSQRTRTVLMHGHVFRYNAGIQYLKRGLERAEFGTVQYVDATRTNLGPVRQDVNAVHDLATHDLTIFDYLFDTTPLWVSAAGSCLLGTPREDVAFITMEYPGSVLAHVHVSWLHPKKTRTLTLVGARRMVTWNDLNLSEPIRVYDKGVAEEPYYDSFGEFHLRLRDADVAVPKLDSREPLKVQAEAFLALVGRGGPVLAEAESGLRLMACLEAIDESMIHDGRRVPVKVGTLR